MRRLFFVFAMVVAARAAAGQELAAVGVEPAARSLGAAVSAPITVRFDRPVDRASVTGASFWAFGRWSGSVIAPATGSFEFSEGDAAVTLVPAHSFSAGEQVMVVLSHDLRGADGSAMRSAGYSFQFWTAARPARFDYATVETLSTRTTSGQTTRSYGGIASDLNHDRFLDLTIVNEDTADLRVFLNRADETGGYDPFIQPTYPVNQQASPSEPTDFNRDGHTDICVANIAANTVSVLLGNGDGTFAPQQQIQVGVRPRGITVLDVDGDGDVDIANTNSGSSTMSVLINDGTGVFGAPTFYEGGGAGEWALAQGDMDEDGILDLVVGLRTAQQVVVNRCNGNGTFTAMTPRSCGGFVWMLVVGDVDGDGHEDVATANSQTNNAGVLSGDGAGGFGPVAAFATDPFPLADDLGDLDGDGDLDWMTSSFDGDWRLYRNDGAGSFALEREFDAPQAASCALLLDIDNDRDLDLALIDELADVVIVVRNATCHADADGDGKLSVGDFGAFRTAYLAGDAAADFSGDGSLGVEDFTAFRAAYLAGCG